MRRVRCLFYNIEFISKNDHAFFITHPRTDPGYFIQLTETALRLY